METILDLLNFILQQDRCIIFGDLGRYPNILYENLQNIPLIKICFVSNNRDLYSSDNRIRVLRPGDPIEKCDLLIYLEPGSLQFIEKHPLVSRVAIFTSHFTFQTPNREWWTNICFFMKKADTAELLEKQDFSIQTKNIGLVKIDHVNVLTISGKTSTSPQTNDTYVIVDLTKFNKDSLSMYLAFWDAFDYMMEYKDLIYRWVVCFPEHGRLAFTRFTQKVLDSLFCKKIEHGNVKDIQSLVTLLPFYKSGSIERKFDVKMQTFGGINYVSPESIEDVCKAAIMYDVYPIIKNVFGVSI